MNLLHLNRYAMFVFHVSRPSRGWTELIRFGNRLFVPWESAVRTMRDSQNPGKPARPVVLNASFPVPSRDEQTVTRFASTKVSKVPPLNQ